MRRRSNYYKTKTKDTRKDNVVNNSVIDAIIELESGSDDNSYSEDFEKSNEEDNNYGFNNFYENDNIEYISSLEAAEMVEKEHSKLIRDIRKYSDYLAEAKIGFSDFWIKGTYKDSNNQDRPCYFITKEGCEFIANKLTGLKGSAFTAKYIKRFNKLEKDALSNRISKLEQESKKRTQIADKRYSRWKTVTFEKLKQIQDVVNNRQVEKEYTLPNIIHEVIINTEDNYNIEMPEYMRMYRYEYNLTEEDNIYVLDVIGYYKDLKDMFTETLNSIVKKLKIEKYDRNKSIFDIVAEKIKEDENEDKEE